MLNYLKTADKEVKAKDLIQIKNNKKSKVKYPEVLHHYHKQVNINEIRLKIMRRREFHHQNL